jgi:aspartyl-tRNA(Asn)/glutamyl-tRNA(Gln) amidotransferase subunit B
MAKIDYKLVVGLEIHVQLSTKTKMFCSCALEFGAEPNSRVCPVCMGMPGSLPVMNRRAYENAVLTATALNCQIARFTKWDRKSYYYPDLPKNYQISQYDLPLSSNGFVEIPLEGGRTKRVGIIRAHLEEDAGKNLHGAGANSQVDLNRAGTPLLEIVTAPDMNSPQEVRALAMELQRIVRYLGVSEADMQKGHMRFEPNVNLFINTTAGVVKTPIAEIKNLNSFKAIERAVAYEEQRQLGAYTETGVTMQTGNKSTRGWDDVRQVTVLQREKEEAHDYRYFPDPDLMPVEPSDLYLDEIRSRLCELPIQKELRFINDYKLSAYDAGVLTADRATAEFFEETIKAGSDPKRACNLLTQVGMKIANESNRTVAELGLKTGDVAELAKMAEAGEINATAAATILTEMISSGKAPRQMAQEQNLIQKSDAGELERILDEVIAENAQAVSDVKAGGKKMEKARGFLMGRIIRKTKGQANPKLAGELLAKKLSL